MKRKVITALLLSSAIFVAACGTNGENGTTDTTAQMSEENNSENQEEETVNPEEKEEETEKPTEDNKQIDFKELTAVDNDECSIKITDVDPDSMWGYELKTTLENKSTDKTYMFSVTSASINGVQCDPFFATEVASGKKSNSEITFTDSSLGENGITEYTDIELSFRVYDSNDYESDNVAEETVHIYPLGEEKATVYDREIKDTDNVIIDNEYVKVIVTGYKADENWGYIANLFLQNKTDKSVMFSTDEVSINGFMLDPFWATSVGPGKSSFSSINWYNTDLEENGISEVEEIEFLFKAYDENGEDVFVDETIKLNP